MNYLEIIFNYSPDTITGEVLLAEVAELPFESFVEEEGILIAYIQEEDFSKEELDKLEVISKLSSSPSVKKIEQVNWNEEWEKNFDPVFVDDKCAIIADFHTLEKDFDYIIRINPKMSFGTGHHATTHLMVLEMMTLDFKDKEVLDMGTGTGVLAILASQQGANQILAIDNNVWAYENSIENVELNGCKNIELVLGEVELIANKQFNVILANINKNVIKVQLESYVQALSNDGLLLISGVLIDDKEEIKSLAASVNLKLKNEQEKDKWSMLVFSK
jgi:ribosomal protein L11 methyltransferase